MSIPEALKGAQADLQNIRSPIDKLKRIGIYARIIGAELLGTLQIIPYGIRAHTLHRSLPEAKLGSGRQSTVSAVKNLKYGDRERNTLDIYLPAEAELENSLVTENTSSKLPVVLFCHGGIWATGEAWHYAPMATRLAQAGIVTAVMQYTLYPQALAHEMSEEVSQALSWTFDNISKLGGDPQNVTLAGHSAGAQLCAMALLHRAAALKKGGGSVEKSSSSTKINSGTAYDDSRMPKRFLGMAGVYDIAKHFEYEEARDVHELSTMGRACGGQQGFALNSPRVILRAAASGRPLKSSTPVATETVQENSLSSQTQADSAYCSGLTSTPFDGDLIAARIGLNRPTLVLSSQEEQELSSSSPFLEVSLPQARHFPPTVLQASTSDVTVPWYESSDMHWALHDCGIPTKTLIYNRVGHGDFVTNWRPLPSPLDVHTTADLPGYAADFVQIVTGEAQVTYTRAAIK